MPVLLAAALTLSAHAPKQAGQQTAPPREQGQIPGAAAPSSTNPQTSAPTPIPVAAPNFGLAETVVEPDRLEITPQMNGQFEDDEWDPFSTQPDIKTFFQWSPGVIYAAATGPAGADMLVSLDFGANGWLVGRDNVEARVSMVGGKATITVNQLDATNVSGPVWKELQGIEIASTAVGASDSTHVVYQLRLADPGFGILPRKKTKIGARIDLIPTGQPQSTPFSPRVLTPVNLTNERAAVLPTGLKWTVERTDKPFAAGDMANVRFTFQGPDSASLKKVEIRPEGRLKDQMSQTSLPFPPVDQKKRAYVDYTSKIDPAAATGYHVLKATLTAADGTPATIEASFRVESPVDVEITRPLVPVSPHDRSVPVEYTVATYTSQPVIGKIEIGSTGILKVLNGGGDQRFTIAEPKGTARKRLELFVPANTSGTFPIDFTITVRGHKLTKTCYFSIAGSLPVGKTK